MRIKLLLFGIVILASILRLVNLGENPPHLTADEASLGYNAYSLLTTGKDEYGRVAPLVFQSFGDYKPGLYIYATVPSIAIFGLNEFAVRFPSAFAGILSVIAVYFVAKELFRNTKEIKSGKIALIASFTMAVNPWSIYFSRGAWEVNVSLALTLCGIYFFLLSRRKALLLFPSAICFAGTLLMYQGAKLSTAIVLVVLGASYAGSIIKRKNSGFLIAALITALFIVAPILVSLREGQAGRLQVFSVFSYPRPEKYLNDFLIQGNEQKNSIPYYLFHSENYNFFRGVLGRWFNHFSGRYLFFEGDYQNPRHSPPNHGMLLLSDIFLLGVGLFILTRVRKKERWFLLLWLVLSPIPAALSRDQVHAVRSLNMSIPLIFILSLGLYYMLEKRKLLFLYIGIFILSFIYFLDSYFVHLPKHNSQYWYYGYKQLVLEIEQRKNDYQTIVVRRSFDQPYIYFLFYSEEARRDYTHILTSSDNKSDVGIVKELGKVQFNPIDWSRLMHEHSTLVVTDATLPAPNQENIKLLKTITYNDDKYVAFLIYEIK